MKKSQAALEFLITYGWAMLSVLVIVGVLIYFGVFNTNKYVSDQCDMGSQLHCEDYILHKDGWIALQLRNNFGVPIDITKITVKSIYGTNICVNDLDSMIFQNLGDPSGALPDSKRIQAGAKFEVNCNITANQIASDDKVNVRVTIEFQKTSWPIDPNTNPKHNQTGNVIVGIRPAGTCSDSVRNCHDVVGFVPGCETDIDCGWPCGATCAENAHCVIFNRDCNPGLNNCIFRKCVS